MDIGTSLAICVSILTAAGLAWKFFGSGSNKGKSNPVDNNIMKVIEAKDYQTNEDVNNTINKRQEDFMKKVCEPRMKEIETIRTEQTAQGKTLTRIDTTLVMMARAQGLSPPTEE